MSDGPVMIVFPCAETARWAVAARLAWLFTLDACEPSPPLPMGRQWGVGLGERELVHLDVTQMEDRLRRLASEWRSLVPPEGVQQHWADLRRRASSSWVNPDLDKEAHALMISRGLESRASSSWVNPDVDLQARIDELNAGLQPRGSSRASSGQGLGARWWRRALAVANRLAKGGRHA